MMVVTTVSITPTEEERQTIEAFANFLDELETQMDCYEHNADKGKAYYTLRALRDGLDDLEEVLHDLANYDNTETIIV